MSIIEGTGSAAGITPTVERRPSRGRPRPRPLLVALGVFAICATAGSAFAEESPTSAAAPDEETPSASEADESPTPATTSSAPSDEEAPSAPEESPAAATAPSSEPTGEEAPLAEEPPTTEPPQEESREAAANAIYASVDMAFTRGDLGAFSDDTGLDRTAANGILYGVSAGARLKQARFGLRWRVQDTTEFNLWSFALSAGYDLPLKPVTPAISAHVGYVFSRSVEPALFRSSIPVGAVVPPKVEVEGLLAGVDASVSYSPVKFLAVGPFVGADLMVLHRDQAAVPRTLFGSAPAEAADKPLYRESGSGLGLTLTAGLRGTFDFALD